MAWMTTGSVSVDIEDADLQQRPIGGWSDEHRQVPVDDDSAHRGAHGVPDVRIGDAMLVRWDTDPHGDNIACLS